MELNLLQEDALSLLKDLIRTESLSRQEDKTADIIDSFLTKRGVKTFRRLNNIWCFNEHYNPGKPTVLLNSHHDTVRPNPGYTLNPFEPAVKDGKIYGLGSNDAGGCLVSLISTFLYFYRKKDLKYNIVLAATAEEEVSGVNGLELIVPDLGPLEFGIIGEPTEMDLAIAEKGLMVLDCTAIGKAGHAARNEGENAIYKAINDINWFNTYQFEKVSEMLGPIKMTVTVINAGSEHNVVPALCKYVVDVRTTEHYNNEQVLEIIRQNVTSEVIPRSIRLNPSKIDPTHPIVLAGIKNGGKTYGSPTTSDQALLKIPTLKMGPGDSRRSHTADEFIYLHEVEEGIEKYVRILEEVIS